MLSCLTLYLKLAIGIGVIEESYLVSCGSIIVHFSHLLDTRILAVRDRRRRGVSKREELGRLRNTRNIYISNDVAQRSPPVRDRQINLFL